MVKYLPSFDYHLIDLNDYTDEQILSLKKSFLINSLLALKHKNDSEYVRKYAKRIFQNLDLFEGTQYNTLFVRTLIIYIMLSSQINTMEIMEIAEKMLPKGSEARINSTFENLIETGREQGLEQGLEQGAVITKIQTVFEGIKINLDDTILARMTGLSQTIIELMRGNIESNFQSKVFATSLAKQIIKEYAFLTNERIAQLTKLTPEKVQELRPS